jgi:hypothetical protein
VTGYTGFRGDEFSLSPEAVDNGSTFDPELGLYRVVIKASNPFEHQVIGIPIANNFVAGRFTKPGVYRIGLRPRWKTANSGLDISKFSKANLSYMDYLPYLLFCVPNAEPQVSEQPSMLNSTMGAPQYFNELIAQYTSMDGVNQYPGFYCFGGGITFDFKITRGGSGAALIVPLSAMVGKDEEYELIVSCVDFGDELV